MRRIPDISAHNGNFQAETRSMATASRHHVLSRTWEFPALRQKGPEPAGSVVGAVVSGVTNSGVEEISAELSLPLKSGCPATETVVKRRRGSNERQITC